MNNAASKMVNFNNPSCCLSLRTATILMAVVDIGLRVFIAGILCYELQGLSTAHGLSKQDPNYKQQVIQHIQQVHPEMKDTEAETIFLTLYFVNGAQLALIILLTIFNVILILGVRQERVNLLKTWLIFKASTFVFSVAYLITVNISQGDSVFKRHGVKLLDVVWLGLQMYFFYVVYVLHREMRVNLKNQQRPKPRN